MNNTNNLDTMFVLQAKLQYKLKTKYNQEFINIMSLALIDEIMEALRETPWKPWKKQQIKNNEKFKEELIDVWHFLINLSLASGMDSQEVYFRFLNKNKINIKRQENDY